MRRAGCELCDGGAAVGRLASNIVAAIISVAFCFRL